ncbi:hypothetical protein [Paracraurococcus lichenis]|uniref:Uncharacterized protein n=1 Tax=Paracraurococcus lichenis TaxID=3064888 RepID=A0ABT9DXC2_9PROT|nr:hypothetical protein [Paracraurococcus sp. LOR1-02]MDO9708549.1 hypothetical protein [Paracraurococcus sp. LOR1-02]
MSSDIGVAPPVRSRRLTRAQETRSRGLQGHPALESLARQVVVPRLAHLHRPPGPAIDAGSVARAWQQSALSLACSLPALDLAEGARALRALNPSGSRFEAICHDVLLPAAAELRRRRDGEGADLSGYLTGVWRLRMLLKGLEDDGRTTARKPHRGATALIVSGASVAPTLEHSMVQRLFQRAGWTVQCCGRQAEEDPSAAAGSRRFDLAWFSVDDATDLPRLRATVNSVRHASRNRGLRVLSGWQVAAPPPPAEALGADALTQDAAAAAILAQRVLALH